jgi:glycogen synthase
MKLLIYSHFFAPSIGGVETIVRSLASGLALQSSDGTKLDFNVTLVTQTPSANSDDSLPFKVVRNPNSVELLRLVLASDLVHVAGPALLPILLAVGLGKPIVVEHHGFQCVCPNGQLVLATTQEICPGHFMAGNHRRCLACNSTEGWWTSRKLWLLTFVRRLLCHHVSRNVVPTGWLGNTLRLPKTETIWHGLEPVGIVREEKPGGRPLVAFQGRLVSTKGVGVLLDAARILREQGYDFDVLVVGDGPERVRLQQAASSFGLADRVRFAGRLSNSEVAASFRGASIAVVPSLGGEVFGLIVASDLGAFCEVLGDSGVIFQTGNSVDLASKMGYLLKDSSSAAALGTEAMERCARHFDDRSMIAKHSALYSRLRSAKRK